MSFLEDKAQIEEKITHLECHIECFAETFDKINHTKLLNNSSQELFLEYINSENLILELIIQLKDVNNYRLEILVNKLNEIWEKQHQTWNEEYWNYYNSQRAMIDNKSNNVMYNRLDLSDNLQTGNVKNLQRNNSEDKHNSNENTLNKVMGKEETLKYIDDDLKQVEENKGNAIIKEKRRDCNDNCNIL